ncbi:MAG: hypothetical protein WBF13_09095 [Candidatus Zixiibacteriota bacterium]
MRGKSEYTKKRHQISLLLKRAKKGRRQAKDKLLRDFGVRLYSPKEVEEYVKEKLKTEVVDESPLEVSAKRIAKKKARQVGKKR